MNAIVPIIAAWMAAWKRSRFFKRSLWTGGAVLAYTLVGFFLLPAIIKWQMLKQLPRLTHRQAAVRQVKLNPYALSLTVRGFVLTGTNGEPFVSFDEFYVNFQLSSIFRRAWVFSEVSLKKPFAQIIYQPDHQFNFSDLVNDTNAPAPPAKPSRPPRVLIAELAITNGAIAFADLTRQPPFNTAFTPIDVRVTHFNTQPDKKNPYSFTASDDAGETFSWSGDFSINPLRSSGSFKVGAFQFRKYSPYLQDYARIEILRGKLTTQADYHYDSSTNALDLELSNASLDLTQFELKAQDTGETIVSIPSFLVRQAEAGVVRRVARVALVKSSGGALLARRNKDGVPQMLALLHLPASSNGPPANAAPAEASAPWNVKIDEIQIDNYALKVEDLVPDKPARLNFDQIALTLRGLSSQTNVPVSVSLALRFQETGTLAVDGTTVLAPLSSDAQIGVTNFDLSALQPYVESHLKLAITAGSLFTAGRLHVDASGPDALRAHFEGGVGITNFITIDDVLFKEFARWDALTIDGINFDLQPEKLAIDQVKFTGLKTSFNIGPDKRSNLQTILRDNLAAAPAATNQPAANQLADAKPAPAKPVAATLAALNFENASFHFSDQSLQPHCQFDVQEFSGSIKGLASALDTAATVDLRGKVDAPSPFSVTGTINPFNMEKLAVDLAIVFTNTDLTAFTPYLEKYAGHPLQKGKLSMDLRYNVSERALKAENGFKIDRLTLGPRNNSPDATKLPVKLAIALLKDMNGRIELNVPVQGKLDDPQFKLGPLIWKVVLNLLAKAATSPFSLLGAMFGGGEELRYVEFEPSRAVIPDAETNKLNVLIRALTNRPSLNLEIAGAVNPTNDRPALAHLKLEQQIKSLYLKEQTDSGKATRSVDEVRLEPKEYERLLRKTYKKTIGRYKPSEVLAQERDADANTNGPAKLAPRIASSASEEHGATRLISPAANAGSVARSIATSLKPGSPAKPRGEIEDMADQLAGKIEITEDDFRELAQARANAVQKYLLEVGQIAAERLFLLVPKPTDSAANGESRVNLSLN